MIEDKTVTERDRLYREGREKCRIIVNLYGATVHRRGQGDPSIDDKVVYYHMRGHHAPPTSPQGALAK